MLNEKEGTHMETISLTHSLGGNTSATLGEPLKAKQMVLYVCWGGAATYLSSLALSWAMISLIL